MVALQARSESSYPRRAIEPLKSIMRQNKSFSSFFWWVNRPAEWLFFAMAAAVVYLLAALLYELVQAVIGLTMHVLGIVC